MQPFQRLFFNLLKDTPAPNVVSSNCPSPFCWKVGIRHRLDKSNGETVDEYAARRSIHNLENWKPCIRSVDVNGKTVMFIVFAHDHEIFFSVTEVDEMFAFVCEYSKTDRSLLTET